MIDPVTALAMADVATKLGGPGMFGGGGGSSSAESGGPFYTGNFNPNFGSDWVPLIIVGALLVFLLLKR